MLGRPCHLGVPPALTHSVFTSPRQCGECGRRGSMQATPPRSSCAVVNHGPSCSASSHSQPHGMRQTRRQHLPAARRWAVGIPSLGPPVPSLFIPSQREAVVQQITGPRCLGPWLDPFTHEPIQCARAGHQRHQGKGDNRLCQQEAKMPGNTYKPKVRTDNCRIAIIKYRLRTTFWFCFACAFENLAQAIPVPWSPRCWN